MIVISEVSSQFGRLLWKYYVALQKKTECQKRKGAKTHLLFYLGGESRRFPNEFAIISAMQGLNLKKRNRNWLRFISGAWAPCSSYYFSIASKSVCELDSRVRSRRFLKKRGKKETGSKTASRMCRSRKGEALLPCLLCAFQKHVLTESISLQDPYKKKQKKEKSDWAIVSGKNHNPGLWFIKWLTTGLLIWDNCASLFLRKYMVIQLVL